MMNNIKKEIHIRLFIETVDKPEAQRIASEISSSLSHFGQVNMYKIEKYWKITEYYEISASVIGEKLEARVIELTKLLGCGWKTCADGYIWTPSKNNTFLNDAVKWCNVELI